VDRGVWEIELFNVTGTYLGQWRYINGSWQIENEMTKSDKTIIPEENK
jgi:hypothetical protein